MSKTVEYRAISLRLWRALRGQHSQEGFSKLLGFTYNKVHRIESGSAEASWQEFVHACKVQNLPLFDALDLAGFKNLKDHKASHMLKHMTAGLRPEVCAKRLDTSRSTINRWLAGTVEPDLPTVLGWIDSFYLSLHIFLEVIVGKDKAREIYPSYVLKAALPELFTKHPILELIIRLMDFRCWQRQIPCSEEVEPVLLTGAEQIAPALADLDKLLQDLGVSDFGEDAELLRRFNSASIDKGSTLKLVKYWSSTAAEIMQARVKGNENIPKDMKALAGYRIFNADKETREKIRDMTADFYQKVVNLLSERKGTTEPDRLVVLSVQLSDLTSRVPHAPLKTRATPRL